ncbi:hypothetical protein EOM09_07995 [bacterium]|nr:hypothetical protein [bacterium]
MIIKNVLGILSILVVMLIIFSVYFEVQSGINDRKIQNTLTLMKDNLNYLCNVPSKVSEIDIPIYKINKEYHLINQDDLGNEICVRTLKNDNYNCERILCNINSSKIIINNTNLDDIGFSDLTCTLSKNETYIRISCKDFLSRNVSGN